MAPYTFWRQPFRRLIWMMPVAFVFHIVEEYKAGFPDWVTHVLHGLFNDTAFALNNAAFVAIMVGLVIWVSRSDSRLAAFLLIAWCSGNIFWDACFHVLTTAYFNRYSPGLITSSIFYLPLSLVIGTAAVESRAVSARGLAGAMTAGLTLLCLMIWYGLFHFAI